MTSFGWVLEWFDRETDELAGECAIRAIGTATLQELFSEPSADRMMTSSYRVGEEQAAALALHVTTEIDAGRHEYFVSGASLGDGLVRTPGGLFVPPRSPAAVPGARTVTPKTSSDRPEERRER